MMTISGRRLAGIGLGLLPVLAGCAGAADDAAGQSTAVPATTPQVQFQKPDDPIEKLTVEGLHCFETGIEAVVARLRAVDHIAADEDEQQRTAQQTGEMRARLPKQVDDIVHNPQGDGTCYRVNAKR